MSFLVYNTWLFVPTDDKKWCHSDSPSMCTFVNQASTKEDTATMVQSRYVWEEGRQVNSD